MAEKIRQLLIKYREQWTYLVVGGCTTVINYIIYFLLTYLDVHYVLANVVAWVGAVAFAYFANGAWVYRSANRGVREAGAFVVSRLFSLGLETVLLMLMVDLLRLDRQIAKLACAVVVVVVNYLTGILVYKKRR